MRLHGRFVFKRFEPEKQNLKNLFQTRMLPVSQTSEVKDNMAYTTGPAPQTTEPKTTSYQAYATLLAVHRHDDRAVLEFSNVPHIDDLKHVATSFKDYLTRRFKRRFHSWTHRELDALVVSERHRSIQGISYRVDRITDTQLGNNAAEIQPLHPNRTDASRLRVFAEQLATGRQAELRDHHIVRDVKTGEQSLTDRLLYDPLVTPLAFIADAPLDVLAALAHVPVNDTRLVYPIDPIAVRRGIELFPETTLCGWRPEDALTYIITEISCVINLELPAKQDKALTALVHALTDGRATGEQTFQHWLAEKYGERSDRYARTIASAAILAYAARVVGANGRE